MATPAPSSSLPPASTLRGLGPGGSSNGASIKSVFDAVPGPLLETPLQDRTPSALHGMPLATDLPAAPTVIRPPQAQKANLALWIGLVGGLVLLLGGGLTAWLVLAGRAGMLQITTDPPDGVRVLLDDKPVQPDDVGRLKVDPGTYTLAAEREGYVQWRDRVEVKAGEVVKRRAELEPLARSGFTLISDPAGATASLDGKDLGGRTPFKVEGLQPGKHKLEVQADGRTWSQEVVLEPGKMIELRAVLTAPGQPPHQQVLAEREPPKEERPPKEKEQKGETLASLLRQPPPKGKKNPVDRPKPDEAVAASPPPKRAKLPGPPEESPPPVKPVERPASSGEGFLRLGSKPWTKIAIDGKDTGETTPQGKMRLSAGRHSVTLTNPQFGVKESFSVEIRAGETETVIKDLRPQNGSNDDE
jgi:hypothetical protein